MKICFVASSGGHLEEIMCLRQIMDENDSFIVTEAGGQANDLNGIKLYTMNQLNRKEFLFPLKFVVSFGCTMKILLKEKPDVVITTGALLSYWFCVIAKLMKKKVIYIESFARMEGKSLTGRLVYPIADLFIVQWGNMLKFYPKAKYGGGIF